MMCHLLLVAVDLRRLRKWCWLLPSLGSRNWATILLLVLAALLGAASAGAQHTVTMAGGHFVVDGKPVQIISGEMHYARIPPELWRDRLLKARAMGLNSVTVYAFWNVHEPSPGQWNFSGQYDVARFIRLAREVGLYVILRPGPYTCAEWSYGGYPAWLLRDPKMQVRTTYPPFLKAASDYIDHLAEQLRPLLWTNGGPIIAVQVENEYGSFGKDSRYVEAIHQMEVRAGLGHVVMYTGDGPGLWSGTLPELPAAIDIGPGDAQDGFAKLLQFRPHQSLLYAAEFYPGWFDSWGKPHAIGAPLVEQLKDLDWILSHGYSVSLYMFHGGTDWGFMNGANATKNSYDPQTTSYDYGAPLDEAGNSTPNYYALRDLFAKYQGSTKLPPVPASVPLIAVAAFSLARSASLWNNLPTPKRSFDPMSFESLGVNTGYVLYRTHVSGPAEGPLEIGGARDYAVVYLNGKQVAVLDRRLNQHQVSLKIDAPSAQLDILVEDSGRINYGGQFPDDRKGLIFPVTFNGGPLRGWENYPLLMTSPDVEQWKRSEVGGPAFHAGTFRLSTVGDTYLDVSALGKGLLWVNDHAIGRIWNIGPQQSDYIPACWLHQGANRVLVFDLEDEHQAQVVGRREHLYALHERQQPK